MLSQIINKINFFSYILLLDSFGVRMSFYVKGYKDYRSHFGGLITIIIYIIAIVCAVIFSSELWDKINPTVSTASAVNPNPTKILYPDDIFFMFSVKIDFIPFIDEKIYRPIGLIRRKVNGTDQLSQKELSLDICSKVFNQSYKYYDAIKHLNLSNFYCISLDKNIDNGINKEDLFINEFWGNDGFQMLQIKVYNCIAIAENKDECASKEIIKKKLESPIISYYTLKNYIDTNNYNKPFINGIQETFYYVSYKKFISATEYLKHVQIHSDSGIFFSNINNDSDITVDSMVEYSEEDQVDGKIFTMSLQLTNKIDYYSRTYYKIQDLGADIGAVYGALHMIFALLFQLYNTSKLFNNIINTFFLINEDFVPLSRNNKAFINLKKQFFNDLRLNISLNGRGSFFISHNVESNCNFISRNETSTRTNISLGRENTKKILNTKEKLFELAESKIRYNYNNIKNKKTKNNINIKPKNKKIDLITMLSQKKEQEKKRIRMDFSCIDRFLCLYLIEICRNKLNRYSYYNLYYKGREYLIKVLDITNYLKYNHFLQMFFLINGKKTNELYEYVTTPILSSNYVGPRFEVNLNQLDNNMNEL